MAKKALFFNALPNTSYETGYDRNYNADDISDWLAVIWENGVVKDGLKIEATTGMQLAVNIGRAAIKGKAFINNSVFNLTVPTAPTNATRYDYIVLKYDNTLAVRNIDIEYRTGGNTVPTVSNLTRNESVYELMLCYIEVGVSVTSISQSNIKDQRGNATLCPWFTAVKGYGDYYDALVQTFESVTTMATAGVRVVTNLAASLYNAKYSIIDVYTNGIKEQESAYTVSTSGGFVVITFTATKTAGAKITVDLGNFIDGEGMSTAIAQYTQWVADVAALKEAGEYDYICNGVNDNVLISNLVKTFLNGGTDYATMKLNVIGNFGMTAPAKGGGTSSNPYGWFDFDVSSNRIAIVDFSRSKQIAPTITNGTYNVIFYSNNGINVIGATVSANNTEANTIIRITSTSTGVVKFENCRFYINSYKDGIIATRGTFINCRGSVANTINNSYCFLAAGEGSVIKVTGGEYYAYCGSNYQSAIVGQSGANAVSILYMVSAPTVARSGFLQTNSLLQWSGGGILNCTDLISALPLTVVTGISNIRGTITLSKQNVW